MSFLSKNNLNKICQGGGQVNSPIVKNNSKTLSCLSILFYIGFLLIPDFAFAAGGLEKANKLLETVSSWLNALSIATVTIAILVVGYKVVFGGQTIRECVPIIIGAILIASASQIANLLLS